MVDTDCASVSTKDYFVVSSGSDYCEVHKVLIDSAHEVALLI